MAAVDSYTYFKNELSLVILPMLRSVLSKVSYLPRGSFIIGIGYPAFANCGCNTGECKQRAEIQ